MNRKNIATWALYDFANSIVVVVFSLYFAQWLVIDKGVSDLWYNSLFTLGSVMLLLTAPVFATLADKNGKQIPYLTIVTLLEFVFFLLTSIVALFFTNSILLAAVGFLLANYFYQFSFVFYNATLRFLAPTNKLGKISGIGQTSNWLGQIIGILVTLPLASGALYLFGEAGRAQTFLPATLLFVLLAAPMLLFFRLGKQKKSTEKIDFRRLYSSQWRRFREFTRLPGMGLFLLAYFLFNDAILTALTNFPLYLQNVFSVPDKTKSFLYLGILATSALGALVSGWMVDRVGSKRALQALLIAWMILFPAIALAPNFSVLVVITIFMGFFFGSIGTVARTFMATICPKDKQNFGFSYYTLAERVSTLIGPLTWGIVTSSFLHLGPTRYRLAAISMTVFVVMGYYFFQKVDGKIQHT